MGVTINEYYSSVPTQNKFYVITGSASFVQFASGTAKMLLIKADPDNIGTFFIDNYMQAIGVYPLDAGDEIAWSPAPIDFSMLGHRNPSGTVDKLYFWAKD